MRYQPANLLGGFYSDSSKPWSVQDTVNWIPEVAAQPGTRTQAKLRTAPGLKPFVEIGPAPIRGSHNCEGKLFVVSGNRLYQISNTGVAIPIGTIPGTGLVQMSHNQRSGGNELIVVTGTAGYVYNTRTLVFERISDPGYPGAGSVDYIDQYLVQVEPFGRFWFHSDLANALEYNTLDRYESEASPDKIVTIITNNLEVVVFNETTTEFFDNTGAATNTFQNKRAVIDVGCAGRNAVAKIDRSLIWLGNDGVVYYLEGYSARPISNPPIEQAISGFNWASAIATVYESEGHKIFYLTFPGGLTFGYDVVTQIWHRRASFGMDRWRINTLTYWNRKWIAGDFQNGRLYELDWKYPLEGDQPLVRERTSGVTSSNQNRITVPYVELLVGVGQKPVDAIPFPQQPAGPTIAGDAPDAPADEPYSYQYTLTEGDAPIAKVTATNLPEGWAISNTGLLTGPAGVEKTIVTTVRVTDENGLWDEVTDTIRLYGMLFVASSQTSGINQFSSTYDGVDWFSLGETSNERAIAASGMKMVGVGVADAKISLNSGVAWTTETLAGTFGICYKAIYAKNRFIAVGSSSTIPLGKIMTSATGEVWVADTDPTFRLHTVLEFKGKVYAVGFYARLYVSSDGISFSYQNDIAGSSENVYELVTNGGTMLALGDNGFMAKTTDGIAWSLVTSPFGSVPCYVGAFGGGQWVVIENTSPTARVAKGASVDSLVLTGETVGPNPKRLVYGRDRFLLIEPAAVKYSLNGTGWVDCTGYGVTSRNDVCAVSNV